MRNSSKEYNLKYYRTKKGLISSIYGGQKGSSKRRGHHLPTYSKKELEDWVYSQPLFHVLFDNWKRLDYQKEYRPSVDRKDDALGYTMSNIQLMTWRSNFKKSNKMIRDGELINRQRVVIQYDLDDNFIKRHHSINSASREVNTSPGNIISACQGIRKKAGGFTWVYGDE